MTESPGRRKFMRHVYALQRRAHYLEERIARAGEMQARGMMYDRRELSAVTYALAIVRSARHDGTLPELERAAVARHEISKTMCSSHIPNREEAA
jgi:hypothetical protein